MPASDLTSSPPGISNVTVSPVTSGLVNPSSKLTLSVTIQSINSLNIVYKWSCPTNPTLFSSTNVLSSGSSPNLVLAKRSLDPWSVPNARYTFIVTAGDAIGNATSSVRPLLPCLHMFPDTALGRSPELARTYFDVTGCSQAQSRALQRHPQM